MGALGFGMLALVALVGMVFFSFIFLASRFKRCPSDRVLVIFGRVEKGRLARHCMAVVPSYGP